MEVEKLKILHQGHVLERKEPKRRAVICMTYDRNCRDCRKELHGTKCVRYEVGNRYLHWKCLECFSKGSKCNS